MNLDRLISMNYKKAFTLIELLVVIAIVGLLATLSVLALNNARTKSRDAKRLSDIKQIQTAMELFFNIASRYPTSIEFGSGKIEYYSAGIGSTTYMATVPSAPTPPDGSCSVIDNTYTYVPDVDGFAYNINFCISKGVSDLPDGKLIAFPGGIKSGTVCAPNCSGKTCGDDGCGGVCGTCTLPQICTNGICITPFACGSTLVDSRDAQSYPTVQIGTQCWMAKNMNIGNMISGPTSQTNNSIFEKYCYNNSAANCTTYGGLYQWDEAMQYSTIEGVQGICPAGWHIPTDAEQNTLDQSLNDTVCDVNRIGAWGCANAGVKLQIGGTSHFEGLLAGYRTTSGSFPTIDSYAMFWSSTISGSDAWYRVLYTGYATVNRNRNGRVYGFSVRCLQN